MSAPEETQRVFGDRYHLVRHVARGGMAQVYLARDSLLDRDVALKVLFPELSVDENFVERFRREAQAAAKLAHPNIVSIYDWGQDDRTYFIVMEYVDGETLSARIRRGPMPVDQAAIVGIATASALAFAHRRNVIHRDVKPGNVLIDRSGQVKVADFGIARAVGTAEGLTQAGAVMGTATYFSPEQAQGQAVDARSDVYSLGVVLHEMAAGRPPFSGDTPVAIAYQHVREPAPLLRSIDPAIPAAYEAIVAKAMAKRPEDRYQTADELRADLERFRSGQPVAAMAAVGAATAVMGAAAATAAMPRVGAPVDPTRVGTAVPASETRVTPAAPPPRDDRSWWWLLILILLVALGLIAFVVARDLSLGAATKIVPNVAGLPEQRALGALKADGFRYVNPQTVTSATVHAGDAVGTQPPAGQRVSTSTTITLVVSAGPGTKAVPDVTNDPVQAAKQALTSRGFKVTVAHEPSATVPKGRVVRTSPAAGVQVAVGSTVTVYASSGPQQVAIPPVAGDSPGAAGAKLAQAGLSVSGDQSQASTKYPSGQVIGTSPPAGTKVPTGTSVTILVSSGPPQSTVPNLQGDTRAQAQAALAAANLTGSFVQVPVSSAGQDGIVQSQSPAANSTAPQGSAVTVDIGHYTPPPTTTTTTPPTTTTTTTAPTTTVPTPPPSGGGPGGGGSGGAGNITGNGGNRHPG